MDSFPMKLNEFRKLIESGNLTKQQLDDLAWLLEHPEYEHRVVDIRTFITSPDYLNCGKECWPSIIDDLEALFNGNYDEAVFCEAIGAGKSFKSSIIIVYMVYLVLCLKNPQAHLGPIPTLLSGPLMTPVIKPDPAHVEELVTKIRKGTTKEILCELVLE